MESKQQSWVNEEKIKYLKVGKKADDHLQVKKNFKLVTTFNYLGTTKGKRGKKEFKQELKKTSVKRKQSIIKK